MTYRTLLTEAVEMLQNADVAEASLDARLLLEYAFEGDRNLILVHGEEEADEEKAKLYMSLVQKRSSHVPLQYITHVQNFMGLDFYVDEAVLIPRQDTEVLVEEVLLELHDGMSVLDMCTGSGAIAISLMQYKNDCSAVGVDLSEAALAVAKKNAQTLLAPEKSEKITFVHSDLFAQVEGKFDRIVSNPPYIQSSVIEGLMPEVRDFEPRMALDGTEDGLYFYRKIIGEAKQYLYRGGMLYFEIGYDQKDAVMALMQEAGFAEVTAKQDFAGLDRIVYGTLVH